MQVQATRYDAYKLIHEGVLALADAEQAGIRIDLEYCKRQKQKLQKHMARINAEIEQSEFIQAWKTEYGLKFNQNSNTQLSYMLFEKYGFKPSKYTKKSGNPSTDDESLKQINLPEIQRMLKVRRLKKLGDYLDGFLREQVDGFIHTFFNLHLVVTYRSCVSKGSKILVARDFMENPDGIPIEEVRVGDYVYCYNDNLKLVLRKVLWAGKTGHRKVVRVHWKAYKGRTGYLDVTPEHLVRTISGEYVEASKLLDEDLRGSESKRNPKHRVLACSRGKGTWGDTLKCKGQVVKEHRLIYKELIGELTDDDVVHHINGNHLDHTPSNLEKHTKSSHAVLHSVDTICSERARINNKIAVRKAYEEGRYPIRVKEQNPLYLNLTRLQVLKKIAKAKGKPTKTGMDFGTFKYYAEKHNIDIELIALRYDKNGEYIPKGRLEKLSKLGRSKVQKILGHNHYRLIRLYDYYGIPTNRKWGNQHGLFVPGNHIITKIEYLDKTVDVYDLEVEECHNFIANEICVHNSSDSPNLQNIPNRDKEAMKLIRKAIFTRRGRQFLSVDFSGIEVGIACCYHQDSTMLKYLHDPKSDMHGDVAKQLFIVDDFDKKKHPEHSYLRGAAKNGFVFPQFYGDYYGSNAVSLLYTHGELPHLKPKEKWKPGQGVPMPGGINLSDHLISKGIKCYDDFLEHVKNVETDFWGKRFFEYAKWKETWLKQYQKKGYFESLTGFKYSGNMLKNEVINYAVQGAAFHCLLWSFIQVNKQFKKYRMDSRLVLQIHDELVVDMHPKERENVGEIIYDVTCNQLKKNWAWITVPMDVEAKICPVDGSWNMKSKYSLTEHKIIT